MGARCLSLRMSRTLLPHSSTVSSNLSGAYHASLVRSCRAALTFPSIIKLENLRATLASSLAFLGGIERSSDFWIALPSTSKACNMFLYLKLCVWLLMHQCWQSHGRCQTPEQTLMRRLHLGVLAQPRIVFHLILRAS